MKHILRLFWGIIARILNFFVKTRSNNWVFTADKGNSYKEGSKYLIEYMLQYHSEYKCTFVTQSKRLHNELKNKLIPSEYLYSFKGILAVAKASCIFYTHSIHDIIYNFKKENRRYFHLIHGQSYKIAGLALVNKDKYWEKLHPQKRIIANIRKFIRENFISDVDLTNTEFVSACSDFLKPYTEKDFGYKVPVKILGMPRNDGLFDNERMKKEKWIEGLENKFIVTYMPTHRLYGHGEITPTPFIDNLSVQKWFKDNNIVFLMKQHPNMMDKLKNKKDTDTIIDITKYELDPQVVIYHSNVLITDFSSVWMDYLLLRRPNLFYIYDDFEHNDAGCHYDIRQDPPGHFCQTESELYDLIKKCKENYENMIPSDRIVRKYHKYVDGNSCERYFEEITNEK